MKKLLLVTAVLALGAFGLTSIPAPVLADEGGTPSDSAKSNENAHGYNEKAITNSHGKSGGSGGVNAGAPGNDLPGPP